MMNRAGTRIFDDLSMPLRTPDTITTWMIAVTINRQIKGLYGLDTNDPKNSAEVPKVPSS